MWIVYMLYPEVNTADTKRRGATLLANGLIRVDEMQVGHESSREEAKRACVVLACKTLKERKSDSTVIGFGIRNFYAKKGADLDWSVTLQQIVDLLRAKSKARKEAALAELQAKSA
jgi:hypothetical protein